MPSNSLPDADFNLPEMKTKSPSYPSGRDHMYAEFDRLPHGNRKAKFAGGGGGGVIS